MIRSSCSRPDDADDPGLGVLDAIELAANHRGVTWRELLARVSAFIHGTTSGDQRDTTGATAKTAFFKATRTCW